MSKRLRLCENVDALVFVDLYNLNLFVVVECLYVVFWFLNFIFVDVGDDYLFVYMKIVLL